MSHAPGLPSPEQLPAATPDTLAAAIELAWAAHEAVLVPDANRHALTLYPGTSPRDRLTIHPTWGATDVYNGTISIIRKVPGRAAENYTLLRNADTGANYFSRLIYDGREGAAAILTQPEESDIASLQTAIAKGTPVRPVGRIARALGKSARDYDSAVVESFLK